MDTIDVVPVTSDSNAVAKILKIVSRREWGARRARYPGSEPTWYPAEVVFARYQSGKKTCYTDEECRKVVKDLQKEHKKTLADIGYNFLISRDGVVYEGRGWKVQPQCHDGDIFKERMFKLSIRKTIIVAFIGNFKEGEETPIMEQSLKDLISFGVSQNHIRERHDIMTMIEPTLRPSYDFTKKVR